MVPFKDRQDESSVRIDYHVSANREMELLRPILELNRQGIVLLQQRHPLEAVRCFREGLLRIMDYGYTDCPGNNVESAERQNAVIEAAQVVAHVPPMTPEYALTVCSTVFSIRQQNDARSGLNPSLLRQSQQYQGLPTTLFAPVDTFLYPRTVSPLVRSPPNNGNGILTAGDSPLPEQQQGNVAFTANYSVNRHSRRIVYSVPIDLSIPPSADPCQPISAYHLTQNSTRILEGEDVFLLFQRALHLSIVDEEELMFRDELRNSAEVAVAATQVVPEQYFSSPTDTRIFYQKLLSVILTFNVGLSYHLQGLFHSPQSDRHLRLALEYYTAAYFAVRDEQNTCFRCRLELSRLSFLAILNNIGHYHAYMQNRAERDECSRDLLRHTAILASFLTLSTDEYRIFFINGSIFQQQQAQLLAAPGA